jgi:hypothetical protein
VETHLKVTLRVSLSASLLQKSKGGNAPLSRGQTRFNLTSQLVD